MNLPEEVTKLLNETLTDHLLQMVCSSAKGKNEPVIRVRPLLLKGELMFQAAWREGAKEKHRNRSREEMIIFTQECLEKGYRQIQISCTDRSAGILVSKKGKITVVSHRRSSAQEKPALEHNRKKNYLLEEGRPVLFLVRLGVMTPEGTIVHKYSDKFRQINRFLEFIDDIVWALPKHRPVRIIDFGCGKSYLTFAVYHYLHELLGMDVDITGLDLKEDVISHCNELAEQCGYDHLHFQTGDIAYYEETEGADLVMTLHACDTATDHALAKALDWKAGVILSVPCCQHELNGQIENSLLEPVLRYGLIKERMAALITDGLRASLLETQGYDVQVLEFIDLQHTPKNILIRAVRREKTRPKRIGEKQPDPASQDLRTAITRLEEDLHLSPTLENLISDNPQPSGLLAATPAHQTSTDCKRGADQIQ